MKLREEREELKKILEKSPEEISKNVPKEEEIPEIKTEPRITEDLNELNTQCITEARNMITNAIAFMIPDDMIESNDYIKNKLEVDVMSLAGLLYQLRLNQIVQKTLTQEISLGVSQARMFEVFAGMSKTIGELNKQLIQTVEAIKETYRTFKNDVKENRTEAIGPASGSPAMLTAGDGSIVTRGTKELINNVKKIKQDKVFLDEANLIPAIDVSMNIK